MSTRMNIPPNPDAVTGKPLDRRDGPAKVTGVALPEGAATAFF